MNDRYGRRPIARWDTPAAIASLLFMLLGCAAYLLGIATDPASLPIDQRAVHDAQPVWLVSANAVAVWAGALGALLWLFRRRHGETLMLMSLIAVAIWLAGLLLAPGLRDL